jgi:hypothetical protein
VKYKSPLLSDASGSVGGLNASHNKGGPYLRAKPHPKNTPTTPRSRSRSGLSAFSNHWRNLSDVLRNRWDTYARNVPIASPNGRPGLLTGYHHFIRSNLSRLSIPGMVTVLTYAPTSFSLPPGLIPQGALLFLHPFGEDKGRIYLVIAVTCENPPDADPSAGLVIFHTSKPFNVGKTSYHSGLTYNSFAAFPFPAQPTLIHQMKTLYFRHEETPFKICVDIIASLDDGRTSTPLRMCATYEP